MIKSIYNLLLHTNLSLIYKLNTIYIFEKIVRRRFLKSYVMSNKSKSLKNRHILPICVIQKSNDKINLLPIPSLQLMIDK